MTIAGDIAEETAVGDLRRLADTVSARINAAHDEIRRLEHSAEALIGGIKAHQCKRATTLTDVKELYDALKHLLDDWERTSTGFPQHIELRYAARDRARAMLEKYENPLAGRAR